MQKIGWIGVGIMGGAMARNLMKAGYEVHIYARRPEKAADLAADGAVFHGSIAECVKASEVVITMVSFPQDVEEVYFAPGNILDSAARGSIVIDMTTTSPTLARRISQEGAKRGLRVLDAPVTGGDSGARAGTLSILAGGGKAAIFPPRTARNDRKPAVLRREHRENIIGLFRLRRTEHQAFDNNLIRHGISPSWKAVFFKQSSLRIGPHRMRADRLLGKHIKGRISGLHKECIVAVIHLLHLLA